MKESLTAPLFFLLDSLCFGFVLGAIYDMIRVIRCFFGISYAGKVSFAEKINFPLLGKVSFSHRGTFGQKAENLIVFLTDIFYFAVISPCTCIFLYYVDCGKVRWYVLLAFLLGFFLYYISIGKIVLFLMGTVLYFAKIPFCYLLYPIRLLSRKIKIFWQGKKEKIKQNRQLKKEKILASKRKTLYSFGK